MKLIRSWVERLDPDLIGFQEVLSVAGSDQATEILDGLGYHVEFARARAFWEDETLDYGNVVAGRWPLMAPEVLQLPHLADRPTRNAISVLVDAPFGTIPFTCTHFEHPPSVSGLREQQAIAICELVERRRGEGTFTPILVGDFNAEPDSSEIRYMTGKQSLCERSVYHVDAWRVAGDGGPGTTFGDRDPMSRAIVGERRIDYVFTGYPSAAGVGVVQTCAIACNEDEQGIFPSDHYGVYAELSTEPIEGWPGTP